MRAAMNGQLSVLELLIAAGADHAAKDNDGYGQAFKRRNPIQDLNCAKGGMR
jgi:hypothetical protein